MHTTTIVLLGHRGSGKHTLRSFAVMRVTSSMRSEKNMWVMLDTPCPEDMHLRNSCTNRLRVVRLSNISSRRALKCLSFVM